MHMEWVEPKSMNEEHSPYWSKRVSKRLIRLDRCKDPVCTVQKLISHSFEALASEACVRRVLTVSRQVLRYVYVDKELLPCASKSPGGQADVVTYFVSPLVANCSQWFQFWQHCCCNLRWPVVISVFSIYGH